MDLCLEKAVFYIHIPGVLIDASHQCFCILIGCSYSRLLSQGDCSHKLGTLVVQKNKYAAEGSRTWGGIDESVSTQGRNCFFSLLALPDGVAQPRLVYERK